MVARTSSLEHELAQSQSSDTTSAGQVKLISLQLRLSAVDSEAERFERMSTLKLGVLVRLKPFNRLSTRFDTTPELGSDVVQVGAFADELLEEGGESRQRLSRLLQERHSS